MKPLSKIKGNIISIIALIVLVVIAIVINLINIGRNQSNPSPTESNNAPANDGSTDTNSIPSSNEASDSNSPQPSIEGSTTPQESSDSATEPSSQPNKEQPAQSKPQSSTPSCLHFEAGRCWDELEMDAYSKGIYDQQYGNYGASLIYDETCDAICRDILEDAYDEGWYDRY